jgi:hypothetical protein
VPSDIAVQAGQNTSFMPASEQNNTLSALFPSPKESTKSQSRSEISPQESTPDQWGNLFKESNSAFSTTSSDNDTSNNFPSKKVITIIAAAAILIISWFVLPSVYNSFGNATITVTFWEWLKMLDTNGSIQLFAIVSVLGSLVGIFWRRRIAVLGGLFSIVFLVVVSVMSYNRFQDILVSQEKTRKQYSGFLSQYSQSLADSGLKSGANAVDDINNQTQNAFTSDMSIGFGFYLSALVSLGLAGLSIKNFLDANSAPEEE